MAFVFYRLKYLFRPYFPLVFLFGILWQGDALGETHLHIPPQEVHPGQSFRLPIMVDQVENLAGVKLVMEYDPKLLIYEKAEKTEKTGAMMQVVNDKTPGRLILVMAGAKGVSGRDVEIAALRFRAAPDLKEKTQARITVTEAELVSGELKPIACRAGDFFLMILPEK